jgi:hypothetical protein
MNVPEHPVKPPYLLGNSNGLEFWLRELTSKESPVTAWLAANNPMRSITELEMTLSESKPISVGDLRIHGNHPHSLFDLISFVRQKMDDLTVWRHFLPGTLAREHKSYLPQPRAVGGIVQLKVVIGSSTLVDEYSEIVSGLKKLG